MLIKKIYIVTIVSLVALLLSGCNNTAKKTEQSDGATNTPKIVVSGQITDAEFALKGENVWIALNAINQGSPYTEILYSSNNGQTWSANNKKNLYIISMQFVDSEQGWAIGNADPQSADKVYYILSTKDGGKSWSKQYKTEQTSRISPSQIQFLNSNDGFARFNNILLSTTDGGESWKQTNSIDNLMSFNFKDNKEGWATNLDSILHTTDGGKTWVKEWTIPNNIKEKLEPVISKITSAPVSGDWVIFSGESTMSQSSKIILSRNSSNQWTIESGCLIGKYHFSGNPAPSETSDIFPVSDASALLVAYEPSTFVVLFKTNDNGKTWSKNSGFPHVDWARVYFANNQGWGVTAEKNTLTIVKTKDEGHVWQTVKQIK